MAQKHEHYKYDSGTRRKSHRKGAERGVNIFIPAAMLRAAGIDPDGPAPEWQGWPRDDRGSSIIIKLYRSET